MSQKQLTKNPTQESEGGAIGQALEELEKAKPSTRIVVLETQSCCGCGCTDIKIEREVPYDSPLSDGDYVESMQPGDELV